MGRRKIRAKHAKPTFNDTFETFWLSLPESERDELPKASTKLRFYTGAVMLRDLIEHTRERAAFDDINLELRAHCMHEALPERQPFRDWVRMFARDWMDETVYQGAGAFWAFYVNAGRLSLDQKQAIDKELQDYCYTQMAKFNISADSLGLTSKPN